MSRLLDDQKAFAHDVSKLITFIYDIGLSCTLGEAYRTPEQAALYAKQGKGIRNSQHCKRLGLDINLYNEHGEYVTQLTDDYRRIGMFWESLSPKNIWGGRWKTIVDPNHFQRNDQSID